MISCRSPKIEKNEWQKFCSIHVLVGINISSGLDIEQRIRVLFSACSCFDLQQNWALNAYSRSALCRSFYDIKRCKSWYTQDIIFFWQEVAQMNIQIMILLVPTLVKHLVFMFEKIPRMLVIEILLPIVAKSEYFTLELAIYELISGHQESFW